MSKGKWILTGIFIVLILGFALTYIPHKVIDLDPAAISKITVFDGNTGYEAEITDPAAIEHIIRDLNEVTFKKGKPSFGYLGYSFRTTFFDNKGNAIKELTINSADTIKYKGFFYSTADHLIDYSYIEGLVRR